MKQKVICELINFKDEKQLLCVLVLSFGLLDFNQGMPAHLNFKQSYLDESIRKCKGE